MSRYTNEQIASDFDLWGEYYDTGATMTREEFDALTIEQRIALLVDVFGVDGADE